MSGGKRHHLHSDNRQVDGIQLDNDKPIRFPEMATLHRSRAIGLPGLGFFMDEMVTRVLHCTGAVMVAAPAGGAAVRFLRKARRLIVLTAGCRDSLTAQRKGITGECSGLELNHFP